MKHPVAWHHWPRWVHGSIAGTMCIASLLSALLVPKPVGWILLAYAIAMLGWMASVVLCEHPGSRERERDCRCLCGH